MSGLWRDRLAFVGDENKGLCVDRVLGPGGGSGSGGGPGGVTVLLGFTQGSIGDDVLRRLEARRSIVRAQVGDPRGIIEF